MLPVQIYMQMVVEEEDRLEEFRHYNVQRRIMGEDNNPFLLSDTHFLNLFRLTKQMVHYLCMTLSPHLIKTSSLAVDPEKRIFTALYFYATGSYQRTVVQSWNLSVSQQMVATIIHEVTHIIITYVAPNWIKFPSTIEELNATKAIFMQRTGFPGVIGAIDCTHVAIIAPSVEEHNYLNRKGFHSKNVQIICDYNLKILNINPRFGGAAHDSFVWNNSIIHRFYHNSWLLGDSGYPQQPWLMTPILNPVGNAEVRYTQRQRSARNCERKMRYDPGTVGRIAIACAVFHNFCIEGRTDVNFNIHGLHDHVNNNPVQMVAQNGNGFEARRQLIERYFN
ncbi:hypothetical protein RI129_002910 [Pyrocoelia pectoralis]|uniref:Putative nuclease HARBI1 n=1 Tax=Pyrocoelia pectoralis TaxID=417401 RepID=A0AAN7VNZ6_9COLE